MTAWVTTTIKYYTHNIQCGVHYVIIIIIILYLFCVEGVNIYAASGSVHQSVHFQAIKM